VHGIERERIREMWREAIARQQEEDELMAVLPFLL
jgi:hypothetical protein